MNYSVFSKTRCDEHCVTPRDWKLLKSAFTLVELVVVIAIIAVLLTVGAVGLKDLSKVGGVTAGVPLAEAAFAEARALASGAGQRSRVLIHADPSDPEKYLKFILVAQFDDGKWVASGRGTYLPRGVYFSQDYSFTDHESGTGDIPTLTGAEQDIFSSPESLSRNENISGEYFFYEFSGVGNALNAGASCLLGTGVRPPGADKPRVTGDTGASNFGGFVVWRKGTTTLFRHPDQMNLDAGITSGDEF